MGFQLQAAPLLSTALVFWGWGWLQWKSSQYNAIGDELDAELERAAAKAAVEQLAERQRQAGERVAEERSDLSTRRGRRMEDARTIRGPGESSWDTAAGAARPGRSKARRRPSAREPEEDGVRVESRSGSCARRRRRADGARVFIEHWRTFR